MLRVPSVARDARGSTVYPSSFVKSGRSVASTVRISDSHVSSGRTSRSTSEMSKSISSEPAIRTCNFTKSTAKEDRFSKTAMHFQLSGRSSSSMTM